MSTGKRAASINKRLREEIRQTKDARRQLESRLDDVEKERDELFQWQENCIVEGLPQIRVEKENTYRAKLDIENARDEERNKWGALIEATRQSFKEILEALPEEGGPYVFSHEVITAWAEMYGKTFGEAMPDSTRTIRRATKDGASVRKQLKFTDDLERRGIEL